MKMAGRVILTCGNRFFQKTSWCFKNQLAYSFNIYVNPLLSVTRSYNKKFTSDNRRKTFNNLNEDSVSPNEISPYRDINKTPDSNYSEGKDWLTTFVETNKVLSVEEWQNAKALTLSKSESTHFNIRSVNYESQMMMACCRLDNFSLGHSLFSYCQSTARAVPIVVLSKYIRLCGQCESEIDEESLLNLCAQLTSKFPVVDGKTAEDLIIGLCRTSKWKDSLKYLKMMSLTLLSPTVKALCSVAVAAFNAGDYDLGWEMVSEMVPKSASDYKVPFEAWISVCKKAAPSQRKTMAFRLLEFIKLREITLERNILEDLVYIFENLPNEKWTGNITKVTFSGVCKSCDSQLESMELADDEFQRLRNAFLDLVIKGKDIYLKTNPEEVERFLYFLKCTAPYSVVLDGLNVAYKARNKKSTSAELAKRLLQAVTHFKSSDRKVLVLGRDHMKRWPKNIFDQIKKQSIVFFTENLSNDDPFILYAALYSGKGTRFLSHDMMRDHLFVLKKANLDQVFKKWQETHQIESFTVLPNGEIYSKAPLSYNPYPQSSENRWHVPFYSDAEDKTKLSWLCLENGKITSLKVRRLESNIKRFPGKF